MNDLVKEIKKAPITAALIIINIIVFLIVDFTGGSENTTHMVSCGASFVPLIMIEGEWYRLFACMFLHFGITHLLNNMLVLLVLGQRLENIVGKIVFILIYLGGGLAGNLLSLYYEWHTGSYTVSAGASGAVFAVMGAMIYVIARHRGRIQELTMQRMVMMAVFSIYLGFARTGVDNAAHIGGLLGGILFAVVLYHPRKRYFR